MKILIVDDHTVLREGLALLLKQANPETITIEASSAQAALNLIEDHPDVDVLLFDLMMPGIHGPQAISMLLKKQPTVPVIVLSSSEEPADVRNAIAAGALGYVPKSAGQRALISAIQMVLNGEIYIPKLMLNESIGNSKEHQIQSDAKRNSGLTTRQIEILVFISEGHSNKAIARDLGLSEKTVKAHITAIFKELNVVNRTQAGIAGRKARLI
jgi:DNA-binding NarL/FixJ family response regulator